MRDPPVWHPRRSRMVMRFFGVFSAFVAVGASLALVAGCGGTAAQAPAPPPLRSLSSVVTSTGAAVSGRMSLRIQMTFDGQAVELQGDGAFDNVARRARFSLDLSSFAKTLGELGGGGGGELGDPSQWKLDAVQSGNALYLRMPLLAANLPDGVEWVRVDPSLLARARGNLGQIGSLGQSDPRALVEALSAVSGPLDVLGREELRGEPTTHYRALVAPAKLTRGLSAGGADGDLGALAGELFAQLGLGDVPVDVWVGDDGLLHKVALELTAQPSGSPGPLTASLAMELYDYGEDVGIETPLPGDFADAASLGLIP